MTDQPISSRAVGSVAEVPTDHAARYLSQLCKHFQHKRPVTFDAQAGQIEFAMGTCRLQAEDGRLVLRADAADAGGLAQLEDVIARHLVRFGFREDMRISWRGR